jgi:hypothetical protein
LVVRTLIEASDFHGVDESFPSSLWRNPSISPFDN